MGTVIGSFSCPDPPSFKIVAEVLQQFTELCHQESVLASFNCSVADLKSDWINQTCGIAVLGASKRGKTSVINALLGQELLPTGSLPVGEIVTEIRYSRNANCYLEFMSQMLCPVPIENLSRYVLETHNPYNRCGIRRILISLPHRLLASGVSLVDVPSKTAFETQQMPEVLQGCGAAIIVISVDAPVTVAELQLILEVQKCVRRSIFVLNKSDLVSPEDGAAIARFTLSAFNSYGIVPQPLFLVSAREALRAWTRTGSIDCGQSGFAELSHHISSDLLTDRQHLVTENARALLANYLDQALCLVNLESQFLDLPRNQDEERRLHSLWSELDRLSSRLGSTDRIAEALE